VQNANVWATFDSKNRDLNIFHLMIGGEGARFSPSGGKRFRDYFLETLRQREWSSDVVTCKSALNGETFT